VEYSDEWSKLCQRARVPWAASIRDYMTCKTIAGGTELTSGRMLEAFAESGGASHDSDDALKSRVARLPDLPIPPSPMRERVAYGPSFAPS
jgi:hypothetical protein